ncbi:unnamed protein product [Ascophyllum nodosum]
MDHLDEKGGRRRYIPVEATIQMNEVTPKPVAGSELQVLPLNAPQSPASGNVAQGFQAAGSGMAGVILLYMLVSMSLTLLDKYIITDLAFNAPLTMIALTYFLMHVMSLALREGLRYRARSEAAPLVRRLSLAEWSLKVLPVAAASGLEVGTSTMGLLVMHVGLHTMIRSTVPVFVLMFSVGIGLQQFRCGLLLVVFLVSGGVALLFSGQSSDGQNSYRIEGFLLTLLSGMLAGLKWTLSQVFLQGRGLCGRDNEVIEEPIHPLTLLHYMSLSSAAILVPFVLVLELGKLHVMAEDFSADKMIQTAGWIVMISVLAFMLVLLEFSFIKRVSSLSLCIIGVIKELLLVVCSVLFMGEALSARAGMGIAVTMIGVALYKFASSDNPPGVPRTATVLYSPVSRVGEGEGASASSGKNGGDAEAPGVKLLPPRLEGDSSSDPPPEIREVFVGETPPVLV